MYVCLYVFVLYSIPLLQEEVCCELGRSALVQLGKGTWQYEGVRCRREETRGSRASPGPKPKQRDFKGSTEGVEHSWLGMEPKAPGFPAQEAMAWQSQRHGEVAEAWRGLRGTVRSQRHGGVAEA